MVLAPAAPQPVAVLLALGAAQLADQALRHHLVKALPVLLGDENPGRQDKGRGEDWGRGGRGTELWILLYQRKERRELHRPPCAVSLSLPQSCEHQGAGLGTPGTSGTEGTLGTPGMLAASPALSHAQLHQGEEFRALHLQRPTQTAPFLLVSHPRPLQALALVCHQGLNELFFPQQQLRSQSYGGKSRSVERVLQQTLLLLRAVAPKVALSSVWRGRDGWC